MLTRDEIIALEKKVKANCWDYLDLNIGVVTTPEYTMKLRELCSLALLALEADKLIANNVLIYEGQFERNSNCDACNNNKAIETELYNTYALYKARKKELRL